MPIIDSCAQVPVYCRRLPSRNRGPGARIGCQAGPGPGARVPGDRVLSRAVDHRASLGPSLSSSVAWRLVAGRSSSSRTPDSTGTFSASLCCAGRYHEAIAAQARSFKSGHWRMDGLTCFILAIAQHHLGDRALARTSTGACAGSGLSEGSTQRGNKRLAATKEKPRRCSPALLPSCRKTFSHTGPSAGSPAFA